jgi:hypothetical protein
LEAARLIEKVNQGLYKVSEQEFKVINEWTPVLLDETRLFLNTVKEKRDLHFQALKNGRLHAMSLPSWGKNPDEPSAESEEYWKTKNEVEQLEKVKKKLNEASIMIEGMPIEKMVEEIDETSCVAETKPIKEKMDETSCITTIRPERTDRHTFALKRTVSLDSFNLDPLHSMKRIRADRLSIAESELGLFKPRVRPRVRSASVDSYVDSQYKVHEEELEKLSEYYRLD